MSVVPVPDAEWRGQGLHATGPHCFMVQSVNPNLCFMAGVVSPCVPYVCVCVCVCVCVST